MAATNSVIHRPPPQRVAVQNFHLVWLDGNFDENDADCRKCITTLRQVVNTVNAFVNIDECIDFITDQPEAAAFMLVSEEMCQLLIPVAQNISQIKCIYIFCHKKMPSESSTNQCRKFSGMFTDVASICEALQQDSKDCDHDAVSISIVKSTNKVSPDKKDSIDCSYMYTEILKDILLTIPFENEHKQDFYTFCRTKLTGNPRELANVDRMEKEYPHRQPVWWYTRETFLYSMVNSALRRMDVGTLMKLGFFVCDLHKDIVALHSKQFNKPSTSTSFVVYRGQGLSQTDFDQLQKNEGGLLAFNNFVSTSKRRDVSLRFIQRNSRKTDSVHVLFVMRIDPSIRGTPFADISSMSVLRGEEEILFSMHSVFRIGQIRKLDDPVTFWQIELQMTNQSDSQLYELTKRMKEEVKGSTGWECFGHLLMQLAQFDQAEELCTTLLKQTRDESEKSLLFHLLGRVYQEQGKYTEAIEYYEKSLEIMRKTLPANHPSLATSYNNIGSVYHNMGEYSKATEYYEKTLEIEEKTLPANHPSLATSYNNIGSVYHNMGEYSKATEYYEKTLEIEEKTLPANHPSLATSYNNIGLVYHNMGEYPKATEYYEKTLKIREKTLPANHPSLATSYNNIGSVHYNMGEYSKATEYYEKTLEIREKTLPANHPDLAISYNNSAHVYEIMKDYRKAHEYFQRALNIWTYSLPANHPHIKMAKDNTERLKKQL